MCEHLEPFTTQELCGFECMHQFCDGGDALPCASEGHCKGSLYQAPRRFLFLPLCLLGAANKCRSGNSRRMNNMLFVEKFLAAGACLFGCCSLKERIAMVTCNYNERTTAVVIVLPDKHYS